MPNERDVKMRAAMDNKMFQCSVSGKPCKCESGNGCSTRSRSQDDADWITYARTALIQLEAPIWALTKAEASLKYTRPFPGPEIRGVLSVLEEVQSTLNSIAQRRKV
jgi:hypothetical protein